MAAAYAEVGDFDAAVRYEEQTKPHLSTFDELQIMNDRIKLYKDKKPLRGPTVEKGSEVA